MNVFWSQSQWEARAKELDTLAKQDRVALERKTFFLALTSYAILFLPTLPALGFLWLWTLARQDPYSNVFSPLLVIGGVITVPMALVTLINILGVRVPSPRGDVLTRDVAPALWAMVDNYQIQLSSPPITEIHIVPEFNAAVSTIPRFGLLGGNRYYLLLGLPLMLTLSPQQFESVIAHELGHLRGGHGKRSAWLYGFWGIFENILKTDQASFSNYLIWWFSRWYGPLFEAHILALRRAQEFEADAFAAQATSPRIAAEALCLIHERAGYLEEKFWPEVMAQVKSERTPPEEIYFKLWEQLKALDTETYSPYLKKALDSVTELHEDHPSLTERLTWLNQTARTLPSPEICAAEHFLQQRARQFIGVASARWKEQTLPDWAGEFDTLQARQRRLATCRLNWEKNCLIDPDEVRLYGRLLEEFEPENARHFYREIMSHKGLESYARLALGRIHLAAGEREGLDLLDQARRLQQDALASVISPLRAYLDDHGPDSYAEELLADALGEPVSLVKKAA